MARAFVDVNMFSEEWFAPIAEELLKNDKVVFVFSQAHAFLREFGLVRKALAFYKLAGELKTASGVRRRIDVDETDIDYHMAYLNGQQCFAQSGDCDDPHIFSLIYTKPTKFVFTMDMRMAACRNHINQYVESRYCDFIVIADLAVYKRHRQEILQ